MEVIKPSKYSRLSHSDVFASIECYGYNASEYWFLYIASCTVYIIMFCKLYSILCCGKKI